MASQLELYVNMVRKYSAQGMYRDLVEYLNGALEILIKNKNLLDNVLETLDVQQHSLGYLFILIAKFTVLPPSNNNIEDIVRHVSNFNNCNGEQIRFATLSYVELYHSYTELMVKHKKYAQAIPVLTQAIEKLRLIDSQLTPIHADLYQLCLCAKIFKPAVRFLDVDITEIATTEDVHHDAKYFLLNYYYGGMIYTALKNYDRALYYFEVTVSTPALAMSHIMLEAYKKYILISLILHGKIMTIPKYSSQVLTRFLKPLSYTYHDLAKAYETGLNTDVRLIVDKHEAVYARDRNLGLVKQVASSLYKKNIQRLTKTFLTLSLADVASRVKLSSPAEAEKYIFNMIKSGEIFATINQKDGMVVFKDDSEQHNTPEMFIKIQDYISEVMDLNKQINIMEENIMLNPVYVKKCFGNQDEELLSVQSKSYSGDPID